MDGYYRIGDKRYKSVTTIIKEEFPKMALDAWKERTPDWPVIMRKASIYGTFMHLQFQSLIATIPPEMPSKIPMDEWPEDLAEELECRMDNWLGLNLELGTPNLVEHTIVIEDFNDSKQLIAGSAGTIDFYGPVDGLPSLLDWKSSKSPQKSHRIQMGAYYLGAKREGLEVEMGIIPYVNRKRAQLVELSEEELKEEGEKFLVLARKSYQKEMDNNSL